MLNTQTPPVCDRDRRQTTQSIYSVHIALHICYIHTHTHTYIVFVQKQLMRRVCTLPYYKFSNRIFFPNYNKKIYIIKHQQHYYQIFNYYTSNTQYNNNSSSFVYKHNNIVTRSKSNNNNRSFNTNQEIRKTSFHQNIFTRTFFSSLWT